ncbi:MAG TPA: hypothetical protein VF155_03675 [Candidatus Dormibacteraeota bacterium]
MSGTDSPLAPPLEMFDLEVKAVDGVETMRLCARSLAKHDVNIDALNYRDIDGTRSLHLLLQDGLAAVGILLADHVTAVTCRPVLVYTLPNHPGTLARYSGALVDDDVPIDFIYQATARGVVVASPDLDAVRASFAAA